MKFHRKRGQFRAIQRGIALVLSLGLASSPISSQLQPVNLAPRTQIQASPILPKPLLLSEEIVAGMKQEFQSSEQLVLRKGGFLFYPNRQQNVLLLGNHQGDLSCQFPISFPQQAASWTFLPPGRFPTWIAVIALDEKMETEWASRFERFEDSAGLKILAELAEEWNRSRQIEVKWTQMSEKILADYPEISKGDLEKLTQVLDRVYWREREQSYLVTEVSKEEINKDFPAWLARYQGLSESLSKAEAPLEIRAMVSVVVEMLESFPLDPEFLNEVKAAACHFLLDSLASHTQAQVYEAILQWRKETKGSQQSKITDLFELARARRNYRIWEKCSEAIEQGQGSDFKKWAVLLAQQERAITLEEAILENQFQVLNPLKPFCDWEIQGYEIPKQKLRPKAVKIIDNSPDTRLPGMGSVTHLLGRRTIVPLFSLPPYWNGSGYLVHFQGKPAEFHPVEKMQYLNGASLDRGSFVDSLRGDEGIERVTVVEQTTTEEPIPRIDTIEQLYALSEEIEEELGRKIPVEGMIFSYASGKTYRFRIGNLSKEERIRRLTELKMRQWSFKRAASKKIETDLREYLQQGIVEILEGAPYEVNGEGRFSFEKALPAATRYSKEWVGGKSNPRFENILKKATSLSMGAVKSLLPWIRAVIQPEDLVEQSALTQVLLEENGKVLNERLLPYLRMLPHPGMDAMISIAFVERQKTAERIARENGLDWEAVSQFYHFLRPDQVQQMLRELYGIVLATEWNPAAVQLVSRETRLPLSPGLQPEKEPLQEEIQKDPERVFDEVQKVAQRMYLIGHLINVTEPGDFQIDLSQPEWSLTFDSVTRSVPTGKGRANWPKSSALQKTFENGNPPGRKFWDDIRTGLQEKGWNSVSLDLLERLKKLSYQKRSKREDRLARLPHIFRVARAYSEIELLLGQLAWVQRREMVLRMRGRIHELLRDLDTRWGLTSQNVEERLNQELARFSIHPPSKPQLNPLGVLDGRIETDGAVSLYFEPEERANYRLKVTLDEADVSHLALASIDPESGEVMLTPRQKGNYQMSIIAERDGIEVESDSFSIEITQFVDPPLRPPQLILPSGFDGVLGVGGNMEIPIQLNLLPNAALKLQIDGREANNNSAVKGDIINGKLIVEGSKPGGAELVLIITRGEERVQSAPLRLKVLSAADYRRRPLSQQLLHLMRLLSTEGQPKELMKYFEDPNAQSLSTPTYSQQVQNALRYVFQDMLIAKLLAVGLVGYFDKHSDPIVVYPIGIIEKINEVEKRRQIAREIREVLTDDQRSQEETEAGIIKSILGQVNPMGLLEQALEMRLSSSDEAMEAVDAKDLGIQYLVDSMKETGAQEDQARFVLTLYKMLLEIPRKEDLETAILELLTLPSESPSLEMAL